MHAKHPNIRFTFDIEDRNSFSLLDIKIIRNTEKKALETSVYGKSTFNSVFTNFKRFIPMAYKTWLLEYMLFCCFQYALPMKSFTRKLSSSKKSLSEILTHQNVIDRCIKIFLNKRHVPKVVELTVAKKELVLVLPYLGQQSFEIRNRIQCFLKKNAPILNLKFFSQENDFPRYLDLKIKSTKCSTQARSINLSVISAMIFIMVKRNSILKLEPVSI